MEISLILLELLAHKLGEKEYLWHSDRNVICYCFHRGKQKLISALFVLKTFLFKRKKHQLYAKWSTCGFWAMKILTNLLMKPYWDPHISWNYPYWALKYKITKEKFVKSCNLKVYYEILNNSWVTDMQTCAFPHFWTVTVM